MSEIWEDPGYKFSFDHAVLRQLETQARRSTYFRHPETWAWDVLRTELWSSQRQVTDSVVNNHNTMVAAGHGVGKLVSQEEWHPTPTGWIQTKDIRPGTELFDEQGDVTRVTGLSPWWDQEMFRVTFSDGESIIAGENHEWNALDLTARSRKDGTKSGVVDWRNFWHTSRRVTTREMKDSIKTSSNQNRWKIPNSKPLSMPDADLPIDPYLLGFWLGDGTAKSGQITIGNSKLGLVGELESRGLTVRIRDLKRDHEGFSVTVRGLSESLRSLGLIDNKHIPMAYLRASERQRRQLLAGIMDSDGFTLKRSGSAEVGIDLNDLNLARGVRELVRSLGYSVRWKEGAAAYTLNGKRTETGTRYRMNWVPDKNPFIIRGRGWFKSENQSSRHTARTIVSIESVGREVSRCIEVDSPSHLYLAGEGMIPTHNSHLGAVLVLWWIDTHPIGEAIALTTAPSTHQVRQILWRNIQKLHAKNAELYREFVEAEKNGENTDGMVDHKLPGYVTSSATWRSDDGVMLAYGRTAPRGREGDAMQGVHGNVLALVDEAVGVSEDMIQTMANNTSTADDRVVMFANPTNPLSYMGTIWHDPKKSEAWSRITISVFDSPKFTDEHERLLPETLEFLTDQSYVDQKKLEYGEDSANYISRVLGQWATDSGMILFPDEVLSVGLETVVIPDDDDPIMIGFDVARSEKGDFSYLYSAQEGWVHKTGEYRETDDGLEWVEFEAPKKSDRRGLRIRYIDRWRGLPFQPIHNERGQRTIAQAANERAHAVMKELGAAQLRYDADGMGQIMGDAMLDVNDGSYALIPIKGNGASPNRDTWYNLRAYGYHELANRMRRGEIDIEIDTEEHPLVSQLGAIEYTFASGYAESIQIMSKKDMKKKGIKSPDAADAANYAAMNLSDDLINAPLPDGAVLDYDMSAYEFNPLYGSTAFWS